MPDEMCLGRPSGPLAEDQELEELSTASLSSLEHALVGTHSDESGSVARRTADAHIVNILRADNFQGPRYEKTTTRLMEYGWLTINKWTGTGEIFAQSRRAGRPVPLRMTAPDWDADARSEVATETVVAGLDLFLEHGLIRGKWNPYAAPAWPPTSSVPPSAPFAPSIPAGFRGVQMGRLSWTCPQVTRTERPETGTSPISARLTLLRRSHPRRNQAHPPLHHRHQGP
ncbi:hypothetical protein [Streptomyces sp. S063]|uniref:hypothetical protein n=1 Tax=Streptomyces sp. S063 TaxID=2005885 RepID=UPI001F3604E8|nr:hypothetical protein [Streptomyces sp. S063]